MVKKTNKLKNSLIKKSLYLPKKDVIQIITWFGINIAILIFVLSQKFRYVEYRLGNFIFIFLLLFLTIFVCLKFVKDIVFKIFLVCAILLTLFYFLGSYEIPFFGKSVCYGDVCGYTEFNTISKATLSPLWKFLALSKNLQGNFRDAYLSNGWMAENILFFISLYYLLVSLILILIVRLIFSFIKNKQVFYFSFILLILNFYSVSGITDSNTTNNGKSFDLIF